MEIDEYAPLHLEEKNESKKKTDSKVNQVKEVSKKEELPSAEKDAMRIDLERWLKLDAGHIAALEALLRKQGSLVSGSFPLWSSISSDDKAKWEPNDLDIFQLSRSKKEAEKKKSEVIALLTEGTHLVHACHLESIIAPPSLYSLGLSYETQVKATSTVSLLCAKHQSGGLPVDKVQIISYVVTANSGDVGRKALHSIIRERFDMNVCTLAWPIDCKSDVELHRHNTELHEKFISAKLVAWNPHLHYGKEKARFDERFKKYWSRGFSFEGSVPGHIHTIPYEELRERKRPEKRCTPERAIALESELTKRLQPETVASYIWLVEGTGLSTGNWPRMEELTSSLRKQMGHSLFMELFSYTEIPSPAPKTLLLAWKMVEMWFSVSREDAERLLHFCAKLDAGQVAALHSTPRNIDLYSLWKAGDHLSLAPKSVHQLHVERRIL